MEALKRAALRYVAPVEDGRIDVLDGVRALAVLLVCWYHIWQMSWFAPSGEALGVKINLTPYLRAGYMGVDVLLLLSGFLLYLSYARAGDRFSVGTFYRRRAARIVPSYLLAVTLSFVFTALPSGRYASASDMALDLLAHVTFTHNLFPKTYLGTPLSGVLWTLAVEMQFYLIFPLLAAAYKRKPLVTYVGMVAIALAFRAWAFTQPDTSMYVNQLPAFLDVYANGFAAAGAYRALKKRLARQDNRQKMFFTAAAVAALALIILMLREQAGIGPHEDIRRGQMARRYPLSAACALMTVSLCFSLPVARFIFGNALMRFAAAVSFQMYLWHQVFAARLRAWGIPPSVGKQPNVDGEQPWQTLFTLCALVGGLLIAAAVTYGYERPLARLINGRDKNKQS